MPSSRSDSIHFGFRFGPQDGFIGQHSYWMGLLGNGCRQTKLTNFAAQESSDAILQVDIPRLSTYSSPQPSMLADHASIRSTCERSSLPARNNVSHSSPLTQASRSVINDIGCCRSFDQSARSRYIRDPSETTPVSSIICNGCSSSTSGGSKTGHLKTPSEIELDSSVLRGCTRLEPTAACSSHPPSSSTRPSENINPCGISDWIDGVVNQTREEASGHLLNGSASSRDLQLRS